MKPEPTKEVNDPEELLFATDCGPDDLEALRLANRVLPLNTRLSVIVVSPKPDEHIAIAKKLIELMGIPRKVTFWRGAQYGRETGIVEPQNQEYVGELKGMFANAKDASIDVLLLTTCYSLMKHWDDSWERKIRWVYHMGGAGVKSGDIGFNWRVGKEWVHPFMKSIPSEKRILLEPVFYNPDMKTRFNGWCSIAPITFPTYIGALVEKVKTSAVIRFVIECNEHWVATTLKNSPIMQQYYAKGVEHLSFGPADILTAFVYCDRVFGSGLNSSVVSKEIELDGRTYQYQSISRVDYGALETFLIETLK